MSSDSEVPNTDATDTTDVTNTTPANELSYIKDEVDYIKYVEDFGRDEYSFYNIIKSYTGSRIILSLKTNKVLSESTLSENGMVTEFLRDDEHVHTTFNTIYDWVTNYNGPSELTYVLDHVLIGSEEVPLWYVLADMKEADDEAAEDEAQDKAEAEEDVKFEQIRINGIVNIVCITSVSLVIIYSLIVITAIDTHLMNPITYQSM